MRADAGFRLLANQERLKLALQRERELCPPWPEQVPAMRAWLLEFGKPLQDELAKMQKKLAELRPKADSGEFTDASERHLQQALLSLTPQVAAFCAPGGPLANVQARLQWAESIGQRSLVAHAEAWDAATAALRASDGRLASARYRGLMVPPQIDLASHGDSVPIPDRDPGSGELRLLPQTGIVLVLLPPGEFWVGANRNEPGLEQNDPDAGDEETPMQPVMLDAFLLARTEMTQAQWRQLSGGEQPSPRNDPLLPVVNVSWDTAYDVLRRWGLDLPTEAQWEYACRAGGRTPWSTGDDQAAVSTSGWFGPAPQRVAQLRANAFGLFDLHGNVAECRHAAATAAASRNGPARCASCAAAPAPTRRCAPAAAPATARRRRCGSTRSGCAPRARCAGSRAWARRQRPTRACSPAVTPIAWLTSGGNSAACRKTSAPIRLLLDGTARVSEATPFCGSTGALSSGLTSRLQPGMPTKPRSSGKGPNGDCALPKPTVTTGSTPAATGWISTTRFWPSAGSESPTADSVAAPLKPGQPLP
jgi:formylglycine-generating enzyme required for sulfatase activity